MELAIDIMEGCDLSNQVSDKYLQKETKVMVYW